MVPNVTFVMVSDTRPDAAGTVATKLGCARGTAEETIAAAEFVIIATPPQSHASLSKAVLEQGRDASVEKPFTISYAEGKAIVDLAKRRNRRVHVAQFRRFFPKMELARDLILSGVFGPILEIDIHEGARFEWMVTTDYIHNDPYGGVLLDTGAHTLDMALYATGLDDQADLGMKVISVSRDKGEPAHEIDCRFELETPAGAFSARLQLSRIRALANVIRIRCERGTLEFDVGCKGPIWIRNKDKRFSVWPSFQIDTFLQAFVSQYRSIFSTLGDNRLSGCRFLNQMRILEALYHHGSQP